MFFMEIAKKDLWLPQRADDLRRPPAPADPIDYPVLLDLQFSIPGCRETYGGERRKGMLLGKENPN